MIPKLVDNGGIWKVLPKGIHNATMDEIREVFAYNNIRQRLFKGFCLGCELLALAGCSVVYLDGSFVTEKTNPGDFDACWNPLGVDDSKIDPVLLVLTTDGRKAQKERFGGEFFPSSANANGKLNFVDFFQQDRYSTKGKGILRVQLEKGGKAK